MANLEHPGQSLILVAASVVVILSALACSSPAEQPAPAAISATEPIEDEAEAKPAASDPRLADELPRSRRGRRPVLEWRADDWAGEAEGPQPSRSGEWTKPKWSSGDRTTYPEEAKRARIQGVVILELTIAPSGEVRRARVLKPLPMGMSEAALEAAKTWRFEPARIDGEAVSAFWNLSVGFSLPQPRIKRQEPETVYVYSMSDEEADRQTALLQSNRERWRSAGVGSYDLHVTCGGPLGSTVRVRDHEIVEAGLQRPWGGYSAGPGPRPPRVTVPDLFSRVERAIFRRVDSLEVEYNSELGYPLSIDIVYQRGRTVCWAPPGPGCDVTRFRATAR